MTKKLKRMLESCRQIDTTNVKYVLDRSSDKGRFGIHQGLPNRGSIYMDCIEPGR